MLQIRKLRLREVRAIVQVHQAIVPSASHHCSCFSCAFSALALWVWLSVPLLEGGFHEGRVDCSLPDACTEKVLDERVMNRGVRGEHFWLMWSPSFKTCSPPRHFSFKAWLGGEPPGSQPQLPQPNACPGTKPAEFFGKNQCHGLRAAGPCFPGLHRITATTRASPHVQAPEKMLLSDTRAQPALVPATEPATCTQWAHCLDWRPMPST